MFHATMFMQTDQIEPGRETKLFDELHVDKLQHIEYPVQHSEELILDIPIHRIVQSRDFEMPSLKN